MTTSPEETPTVRLKGTDRCVVWVVYFDADRSRSEGRAVPKHLAVRNPRLIDVKRAAEELGLNPEVQRDKAYPKRWWEDKGRLIVDKIDGSKRKTILAIAEKLKEMKGE
ncbi:MAG: signal recognition particle protein Srp19 [Methanopyri archaeon]|nr:signal recognition particle protein Srp19 [Methanopyri archaeon]